MRTEAELGLEEIGKEGGGLHGSTVHIQYN